MVSADAGFGTLLAIRGQTTPSVILADAAANIGRLEVDLRPTAAENRRT